MRLIDSISELLGQLAAWLFVLTGALLTYEVVARYGFNAPTTWASEISQILMIAGVVFALGRTLRRREQISIDVVASFLGPLGRKLVDSFTLLFVGIFSAATAWWGSGIAWDSYTSGRSTGTMLNIPNWWTEILIPIGLFMLALQCLVEFVRIWMGGEWQEKTHDSHDGNVH